MTTLAEARDWLRERIDDGADCPCCTQFAKVYRRKINSGMARALIAIYRADPEGGWVHLPTVLHGRHADEAKLAYWGLLEESTEQREDGSRRAGWWRITPLGAYYVLGRIALPKYARIYNGRCLDLDHTQTATIHDALGTRFDYTDLMAGR